MTDVSQVSHKVRHQLEEFLALSNDLTERLSWQEANPAPNIPYRCSACQKEYGNLQLTWSDVVFELSPKGRGYLPDEIRGFCPSCGKYEEEED